MKSSMKIGIAIFLGIIVISLVILGIVLSGTEDDTIQEGGANNSNTEITEDENKQNAYVKGDIVLVEDYYLSKRRPETANAEFIKKYQGKIKQIFSDGIAYTFFAEDVVAREAYGTFKEIFKLNEKANSIIYFDNIEIGKSCFAVLDDKIYGYNDTEGTLNYKGIDFDSKVSSILSFSWNSNIKILEQQGNKILIKEYSREDENSDLKMTSYEIESFELPNTNKIEMKELIVVESMRYGFITYVKTTNNDIYKVAGANYSRYSENTLEMESKSPYLKNVDKIFKDDSSLIAGTFYSKVGDSTKVYSHTSGESLLQTSDDIEIYFNMPDNHIANDVVEILSLNGRAIFVFNNGDVYISTEEVADGIVEYNFDKLEDVSKLNAKGKIVDLVGSGTSSLDSVLYILQTDGRIYAKEI